jgi:AcrR family transcriptional regulator
VTVSTQLSLEEVSKALDDYFAVAEEGGRSVTIAEFASQIGLKRPTLYARFPEIATKIAERKTRIARQYPDVQTKRIAELTLERTEARRAEAEALRQVRVLANKVRHLTLENAELMRRLEATAGLLQLSKPQKDRS